MGQDLLFDHAIQAVFERFNEPVVPLESIRKWLGRFDDEDKTAAMLLLRNIEYHSQPRITRETRQLHNKLVDRLARSHFDVTTFHDVDFSREFTCKSGDVVSFIYRKSNLLPTIDFKTFDLLTRETAQNPDGFKNRGLVILDDYIGTGSQFIFEFIAGSDEDVRVVNSYRKTYLVCYVIHEKALHNFRLLADGQIDQVISAEEEQFPDEDFSRREAHFRKTLVQLDWKNIELVYLEEEKPLLSHSNETLSEEEKESISRLLTKYMHEGYCGTSYLLGHNAFFFGSPNSLPEILWPLFNRIEDFSIYSQKPGDISEEVIGYTMDDSR
jgi:hypothetical protein